jgi:hypothetical protein
LEQSELEKLIEELESRVDRLRSLYEQYFMGLEKLVPAVAHKDVERRMYVLRRQTIRNTGLRFRFQNVLLRYNTYSTYWMRIVRQIEEGTYKRDVRRAKARFGGDQQVLEGRRRARARKGDDEELAVDVEFELDVDVDVDDLEGLEGIAGLDGSFGASFEDEEIAKAHAEVAKMRAALQSSRALRAPSPAHVAPPSPAAGARPGPARPAQEAPAEPATEPKLPAARPVHAPPPPVAGGVTYAVRGARRGSELPPPLPIAGLDGPPLGRAPSPAVPPDPGSASSVTRRGSSRPAPRPSSRPIPAAAAARAVPARPRQPPPAARAAPPPPPNLSDERVRQLYTQLVETKRKVGESTAAITFESLSRSLRDSSEKLKQKHAGKNVDFEVAVKDGKAVLRAVVK